MASQAGWNLVWTCGLSLLGLLALPTGAQEKSPSPGGEAHRVHALQDARVIVRPGEALDKATILIRDGVVEAVGDLAIPQGARVWDMSGFTIYPGLIEPYLRLEEDEAKPAEANRSNPGGARHENPRVRAERSLADELNLDKDTLEGLRRAGFTAALLVPGDGIMRGQSVLVNLRDGTPREQIVRPDVAQHVALTSYGWGTQQYPHSLMGSIALVRQTLLDARHYQEAHQVYARHPLGQERPHLNVSLSALGPALRGEQPVCLEAKDAQMLLRGVRLFGEGDLKPWIVTGNNDEYRWLPQVRESGCPLVLSVNFPPIPEWEDADEAVTIETEALRHWYLAPENSVRLQQAELTFAFTSQGLKDRAGFRQRVREAIERGLSEDRALAAWTTVPAQLLGTPQLGTIAPGMVANLTVCDGPLFGEHTQIMEVWVDGYRYETPGLPGLDGTAGSWELELEVLGTRLIKIENKDGDLSAGLNREEGEPLALPAVELWRDRLELTLPAEVFATPAEVRISGRIDGRRLRGTFETGRMVGLVRGWLQPPKPGEEQENQSSGDQAEPAEPPTEEGVEPESAPESTPEPREPEAELVVLAHGSWPPHPEPTPAAVLLKNATLWTQTPQGTLSGVDMLCRGGRIVEIGRDLSAPADAFVLDARGRHVTPGIIDCHNHWLAEGGLNEGTHNCTAEVRISDVLDAQAIDIYRHLAGGLTTANLLHGSANAIGGQSAVVKLRWGAAPQELLFSEAAPGIKFALGENPKRSGWAGASTPRYPTSRMGVMESIRERFLAARNYTRERMAWADSAQPGKIPPRVDLQLEALAEVLAGERQIHCHSYRQDEILALIRLAEEFGITVGTFQHVLEGYKVADEIAAHGAGASTFSDWWAYKFEVYDAIAYNGAIMWKRGVTVSFNSDSPELARRLNQEAGKAVRYGGVPEIEALKFVTLNPAAQLGVAAQVGSLEAGKHADFVIWSDHPLGTQAICQETWIEGRRYYQRERDQEAYRVQQVEREALLKRARKARYAPGARTSEGWQPTFQRPKREPHLIQGACCATAGDSHHEEDVR